MLKSKVLLVLLWHPFTTLRGALYIQESKRIYIYPKEYTLSQLRIANSKFLSNSLFYNIHWKAVHS